MFDETAIELMPGAADRYLSKRNLAMQPDRVLPRRASSSIRRRTRARHDATDEISVDAPCRYFLALQSESASRRSLARPPSLALPRKGPARGRGRQSCSIRLDR